MTVSDEDVLLLRPKFALDPQRVEQALEAVPGSFRHPARNDRWVLPSSAVMADVIRDRMRRDEATFTTQVRQVNRAIEVIPGETWLDAGRARKFVETLLAMGPFELEVGGQFVGEVRSVTDVYGDTRWEDPDFSLDPTESPPRKGNLVTFYRDGSKVREFLAIHDSGIVSYEQREPVEDVEKTYRRIAPAQQAPLSELIAALPFLEEDGAGPAGEYIDPVYIRFETPTGEGRDAKLDAANPSPEAAPFVKVADSWVKALRSDRAAVPPGLIEIGK